MVQLNDRQAISLCVVGNGIGNFATRRNINAAHSKKSILQPCFVLPEEEWQNLHDTLKQIIDLITRCNADDSGSEWIKSEDASRIFGVSTKTWHKYRDKRIIPFSQIGRKIYVNCADLDAFLRRHRIPAIK